jgi:hypothetical protein
MAIAAEKKEKALQVSRSITEKFVWQKFTGSKRMVLAKK